MDTLEIQAAVFTGVDNVIMGTALNWLIHTWPEFCKKMDQEVSDLSERHAELIDLARRFDPIADAR